MPRSALGLAVLLGCVFSTPVIPAQNQKPSEPSRALLELRQRGFGSLAGRGVLPDSFPQLSVQDEDGVRIVNFPLGFAPSAASNVVYSRDGTVGFVASLSNDRLFSFDTTTGEMIGNVTVGSEPEEITINQQPDKRLILVKNIIRVVGNDVSSGNVSIVDATDPAQMQVQATFVPPSDSPVDQFFGYSRPAVSSDGKVGFIASDFWGDTLYIFDTRTGDMLSSISVGSASDTPSLVQISGRRLVALVSSFDSTIRLIDATSPSSPRTLWTRSSFFGSDSRFLLNNIVFNSAGTIGYVARWEAGDVFSFQVENGAPISRIQTNSSLGLLVLNEVTGTLAVTDFGSGTVSILSTTRDGSLALQATFTPPDDGDLSVFNNPVLSADGAIGFVASSSTSKLYAFSTSDGTLIKSIQMQGLSWGVGVFRIAGRRLASVINSNFSPSVTLVDYTDPSNISVANEFRPNGAAFSIVTNNIVFSHDGGVCFIASAGTDLLYSVDTTTGDILDFLVTGIAPRNISMVNDGSTRVLTVVDSGDDSIAVVDASDPHDLKMARVISSPSETDFINFNNAVISRDGQFCFIADRGGNRVFSFEIASGTLVSGALVGEKPTKVSYNRTSNMLAVVNTESDTISLLRADMFGNLSLIATYSPPSGSDFDLSTDAAFSPDGNVVYVSSTSNNFLYSFGLDGTLISSRRLLEEPSTLAISKDGNILAVSLTDSVTLFDTNKFGDFLFRAVLTGSSLFGENVVFSTDNNFAYVTSQKEGNVLTYNIDGSPLDSIAVGERPTFITRSTEGQLAVNRSSHSIALIDPKFK